MKQENVSGKKAEGASLLKLALDMGPLVVFFGTYAWAKGDAAAASATDVTRIVYATVALMIATAISLILSRILLKRIAVMPMVTGVFVLIFGGLTIYLRDPTFIKIKPTILYLLFAGALAGGLYLKKLMLKSLLSEALQMQDEGWRLLTQRWIGFFIALAILNEFVWRNYPESTWVAFKSFGVMPLTAVFMAAQISLIMKYQTPEVSSDKSEASST
jgi:intracellular septation protein